MKRFRSQRKRMKVCMGDKMKIEEILQEIEEIQERCEEEMRELLKKEGFSTENGVTYRRGKQTITLPSGTFEW